MTRPAVILIGLFHSLLALGQGGDQQLKAKAEALFSEQRFAEAMPMYSQLVSLEPADRDLNYRLGACILYGGEDKEAAIGHLKFATGDPGVPAEAWYWLGRAYHLNYRFKEAQQAYQRFVGTGDRKAMAQWPVTALEQQCRNGEKLLNNLKEIDVRNKVEVAGSEFFRFYDLSDIGGKIVVTPDELRTSLDKKNKYRGLIHLPAKGGPIYFGSYGKDGRTGVDLYRTELMPNGSFAQPIKLAGYINTDQDDDYAFLHPDGRTFYFSSNGHNSMGGYDVFRAAFDKGLDTFGRPENLDFAVNTPDDDIFYLVDPEHKEACFASGRGSKQGKLHVYRVSTRQMPLILTVLKGTYASDFDKEDRKARIVVHDLLTNEQVADVRTDINGSYILSLPRSGRYRYAVECGPSGSTHGGVVEVPKSDTPKAYRQELALINDAGSEKLVIRNYFDSPLDDDIIALALDEIKRRARLDVSSGAPLAERPTEQEAPTGDIMTRAGFTGDIDEAEAIRLAKEDEQALEQEAAELRTAADEAYEIALAAVNDADRLAGEASQQVSAAGMAEGAAHDEAMTEAARTRQRSREAHMRARAAHRTAQDLEAASHASKQRSITAGKLAMDLQATLNAPDKEAAMPHLVALRERLAQRSRPDPATVPAEKARLAMREQEEKAARAMAKANASSSEQTELAVRIDRLKREQATAKGGKKEELARTIAEQEGQLRDLRTETETAFVQARTVEQETAVLRGQVSLTKHLTDAARPTGGKRPTEAEVAALGQRIGSAGSRIAAVAIDERYAANIVADPSTMEARSFAWDLAAAGHVIGGEREGTRSADRSSGAADAERLRTVASDVGTADPAHTPNSVVVDPYQGNVGREEEQVADAVATAPKVEGSEGLPTPEQVRDAEVPTEVRPPVVTEARDPEMDRFVRENELAELRQMHSAETDPVKKEALARRMDAIRTTMGSESAADTAAGVDPVAQEVAEADRVLLQQASKDDMARVPLTFDDRWKDEDVIARLFKEYTKEEQQAQGEPDADARAAGLHGVELMLADSLRGEMVRQLAILELDPGQAERVLPRVGRLRRLREQHLALADMHLSERQGAIEALVPPARVDAPSVSTMPVVPIEPNTPDPIEDRFVALTDKEETIFDSEVRFRSAKVDDAVAFKQADLDRIARIEASIDSLNGLMAGHARDREFDRMEKQVFRLADEKLIILADMGQRSAFLTKEERAVAEDSLKRLDKEVGRLGLAPSDPLLIMAQGFRTEANTRFSEAQQHRKRADRIDDIVERGKLYRQAYTAELRALRDLDKAMTVDNYLLGTEHIPGEALAYRTVATRVLDLDDVEEAAPVAEATREQMVDTAEVVPPASEGTVEESAGPTGGTAVTEEAEQGAAVPDTTSVAQVPETVTVPTTSAPVERSAPDQADALAYIERMEARLPEEARRPAVLYGAYLDNESGGIRPETLPHVDEPEWQHADAMAKAREARELQAGSISAGDLANAQLDSAATAKRRDRERLTKEAARNRQLSDSLHLASVLAGNDAQRIEEEHRAAMAAARKRERLVKYYYLDSEELLMLEQDGDRSRYFEARARALEQHEAAASASEAAASNRELGTLLAREAEAVQRQPGLVAAERARLIGTRSDALLARADSLTEVAGRLREAATLNEGQAAVMLQAMEQARATELMALEMRTRRTDQLLTQAEPGREAVTATPVEGPATEASPGAVDQQEALAEQPVERRTGEGPARIPAVLTTDIFEMRAAPRPRSAAVPIDAPMPTGVVFKVQVGAFRNEVPASAFSDMTPLTGETTESGLVRYTAGMFTGLDGAERAKQLVRERGYRDAFVVAYRDGERITLAEAVRATSEAERTAPPAAVVQQGGATERPPVVVRPPVTVPVPEMAADSVVLASYPATAEEVIADFRETPEATSYYNVPGAAPATQVETVRGLFYTVQVGVYSKPVPLGRLFGITPLNSERLGNGTIRYTTGTFNGTDAARTRKDEAVERGVKDAFITAYLNGKRIPVREANALLNKFGPSILAKP